MIERLSVVLTLAAFAVVGSPARAADCDDLASDCNANGVGDACDVDPNDPDGNGQTSPDCDDNGVPDECDVDTHRSEPGWIYTGSGNFGRSVAMANRRVAIGAPGTSVAGLANAGAVYLFDWVGSLPTATQTLTDTLPSSNGAFGTAVVIAGDCVFSGSPGTEIGGDPEAGVQTFRFSDGAWLPEDRLDWVAWPLRSFDGFASALAASTDWLAIGVPVPSGFDVPAVLLYRHTSTWVEWDFLRPADAVDGDRFGAALALWDEVLVVGAPRHDGDRGAAYIYEFDRDPQRWVQVHKVLGDPGDRLGTAVAVQAGRMLIGAPQTGSATQRGRVLVYERSESGWAPVDMLTEPAAPLGAEFGAAVGMDGDRIAVTAAREGAGRVYLYENMQRIAVIAPVGSGLFRSGLALDGHRLAVIDSNGGGPDMVEWIGDCDADGALDRCEIAAGAADNNGDFILDACQADCNGNGVVDEADIDPTDPDGDGWFAPDCNGNHVPDSCDLDAADPDGDGEVSDDCDANGVPDECAPDCDQNGIADACDVDPADPDGDGAVAADCDQNGVPDVCQADCDGNGVADVCDVDSSDPDGDGSAANDCNANVVPDGCEIGAWRNEQILAPADLHADAYFGVSGDTWGERVVIGAPGVDDSSGAAYVYRRDGFGWTIEAKLTSSDRAPLDFFGRDVAMWGDRIVVGALLSGPSGAVYVFERIMGEWVQTERITSPLAAASRFAEAVGLYQDVMVVGDRARNLGRGHAAIYRIGPEGPVLEFQLTGAEISEGIGWEVAAGDGFVLIGRSKGSVGTGAGSVIPVDWDSAQWVAQPPFEPLDVVQQLLFGQHISVDGQLAAIARSGSTYVFERNAGVWTQQTKLMAPPGFTYYGGEIRGNRLAVSVAADSGVPVAQPSQILEWDGATWLPTAEVIGSDAGPLDYGAPTVVGDGIVVHAAPYCDNQGRQSGRAYIFEYGVDADANGVLDACQQRGDLTGDGSVDLDDLLLVLGGFGLPGGQGDADGDGDSDLDDLLIVLGAFGE